MTAYFLSIILILIARFLAGVFAGLLWLMMVGYATKMVRDDKKDRATIIVILGVTIALLISVTEAQTTIRAPLRIRSLLSAIPFTIAT